MRESISEVDDIVSANSDRPLDDDERIEAELLLRDIEPAFAAYSILQARDDARGDWGPVTSRDDAEDLRETYDAIRADMVW